MSTSLPKFPEFKPVNFIYKNEFEQTAFRHGMYADFNFNNFYAWNVEGEHFLSKHNDNLVLRFSDYVSGEPFYSLIGTKDVDCTIDALLKLSATQGLKQSLSLIPESTIAAIDNKEMFIIEEDEASHDYILSIPAIAEFTGRKFNNKRRVAKKLEKSCEYSTIDVSTDKEVKKEVMEIMLCWEEEKLLHHKEVEMRYEMKSVELMLHNLFDQDNLLLTIVRHGDMAVGFSIDELLPGNYVLSHYFKTLPSIKGLTEFLNMKVARNLTSMGYRYWNWQQDLGLSSLRNMKLSYRPISKLKKYTVERKNYYDTK